MEANKFNQNETIMKMFIDNAKTFIQLSTGALILPITFIEKVIKPQGSLGITDDIFLILSWLAFLISIGFGAFYQYLAVKYLEFNSISGGAEIKFPKWLTDREKIYLIMIMSFYLGAILFIVSAILRM
jgi:hypothetical protein